MGVKLRGRGRYLYSPTQLGPELFLLSGRGDLLNASDTAAVPGELVKTWNDISGNTRHATQGTDSLRAVMSRADNKENQVYDSELTNVATYWAGGARASFEQATTISKGGHTLVYLKEDGTAANTHYKSTTAGYGTWRTVSGATYKFQVIAYSATRHLTIRFNGTGFANGYTTIDLSTGATIETAAEVSDLTATAQGDGSYLITFTATANATGSAAGVSFYLYNGSRTYNGDNTSGVYIGAVQFARSAADATYLATTTTQQFTGINGHSVPVLDEVDDRYALAGDVIGTSTATVIALLAPASAGGGSKGRVFDNGKGQLYVEPAALKYTSDGAVTTAVFPALSFAAPSILSAIRAADGGVTCYVNGAAHGSASQASGTPAAATTALNIGNRDAGDRGWNGAIAAVLVFSRILNATERRFCEQWMADEFGVTLS